MLVDFVHENFVHISTGIVHKKDKYVQFHGLVPLANRIKEECYRDLDVVMIHCKKAGFSVEHIEHDGKFKSIMDKVSDEMGIEMNYASPDDLVPEADRNNIVIK